MLDTARFSSLIAAELKAWRRPRSRRLILGEHGDSMVPIWSSAAVNGLPLAGLAACTPAFQNAMFERTQAQRRGSDPTQGRRRLGGGIAIRDVIHAIALNQRRLLPVASLVQGVYGIRECLPQCSPVSSTRRCGATKSNSSSGPRNRPASSNPPGRCKNPRKVSLI
jgi:L-lactate dehydrogenase